MKKGVLLVLAFSLATGLAESKDRTYQTGIIVSMNSVPCGTRKGHRKTEELLCHEYVLRSGNIDYHVQQRQLKSVELLPVGAAAEFRIQKDHMFLRVPMGKGKERQLLVVAEAANSGPDLPNAPPQR